MRLTEKVHQILTNHLKEGDQALDATAGNGYDTLFLAKQVGPAGKVIAIDIQDCAIRTTKEKLESAGLVDRVRLVTEDHAQALSKLTASSRERISAITFNLGYLPGSDKSIRTHAESTEKALTASIQLLCPAGCLCVTVYRGHNGGTEEAETVETFMRKSQTQGHEADCYEPGSINSPPVLWILRKRYFKPSH